MRTPEASVFGSYGYGWQQFRKYFLHVLLIGIVLAVANALGGGGNFGWPIRIDGDNPVFEITASLVTVQILLAAYRILVLPVVDFGAKGLVLKYMRNEEAEVGEIFRGFKTNYLNIVLANLLVFVIVGVGLVLLIVPGIIFMIRLSFVPYLVVDKDLDPVAAVEKSWSMTRGYSWRILGMGLLAIPLVLGGLLLLVIGAFFALIWIGCAFASFYHAVDMKEQAALDQNGHTRLPEHV